MMLSVVRTFLFSLALATAVLGTGCASVPMESEQMDAKLKKFEAPADIAGLYVYRNETFGAAIEMQVTLDGATLGRTGAKTYLYKEVVPGKHVVSSVAENVSQIEIETKPGTLSFIFQEVKMGLLSARSALQQVSADIGKAGVLESKAALVNGQTRKETSQIRSETLVQASSGSGTLSGLDPIDQEKSGTLSGLDPVASVESGTVGGVDPRAAVLRLDNEGSVPFISDLGKEDYRVWLQWYGPKAFAISENGKWYGAHGTMTSDPAVVPADPSQRALQFCEKRAKMPCKLYAVDRSVVWGLEMAAVPK